MPSETITLQYPTKGAATLTSKNFSAANLEAFRRTNLASLRMYLRNDFPTIATSLPSAVAASETVRGTRTTARIIYAPKKPGLMRQTGEQLAGLPSKPNRIEAQLMEHKSKVKSAVKLALEWIDKSPANLRFPNNQVDVFAAEEHLFSLGYLWQDSASATQGAAILLGRTAAGWSGAEDTRTVAQECYEHYRKAYITSSTERRIMTTLVHEMGHVFHQIHSLPRYILMARMHDLALMTAEQFTGDQAAGFLADFNAPPSQASIKNLDNATKDFGKGVSMFAGNNGGNELVSEVFCAQVMGSPIGYDQNNPAAKANNARATAAEIIAAAGLCGGATPEAEVIHTRKA